MGIETLSHLDEINGYEGLKVYECLENSID